MAIPYGVIPIEAHMAMISAEQANVPVLADAARMWTEVRAWIEQARLELHTRAHELLPQWPDEAGREFEQKVERTLAELQFWGQRIDSAQVVATLTTMASAIPQVFQAVTGFYQGYLAALSNPFTAAAAPAFQQAAGAAMTVLGAQFDGAMLKVCAAAGIESPSDVLPDGGVDAEDVTDALSSLQSLNSALGAGSDLAGMLGGGPSLAGLAPVPMPTPVGGPELSGLGGLGGGGVGAGGGVSGIGAVGGRAAWPSPTGLGRPAGLGAGPRPGGTSLARSSGAAAGRGVGSPMMPPMGGGAGGGARSQPKSEERSRQQRARGAKAVGAHGVPATLRGRSGKVDPTLKRRPGQEDS
ncbi:Flagelliform silk protein [Alloactinosynnema sp. L-07]|nr:Flagelliform silk protein [Alloactinosynnema sp. L-07]